MVIILHHICFTALMGMFEKRRFRKFLIYVQELDENDPSTWQGLDPHKCCVKELYDKFSLDGGTVDFTGHALSLYLSDE